MSPLARQTIQAVDQGNLCFQAFCDCVSDANRREERGLFRLFVMGKTIMSDTLRAVLLGFLESVPCERRADFASRGGIVEKHDRSHP